MSNQQSKKSLPRPHKRPSQARSQFTVQVIYDAFVRIWCRRGPAAATMRSVAEEAGYAVGTLYEYFPNREAVLSGYFRQCLEDLCVRLIEADSNPLLPWPARLRRLVSVTLDEHSQAPYFDADMLLSESAIADSAQHQKAFRLLCETWQTAMAAWPDLRGGSVEAVEPLVLCLWGARRYGIVLGRQQAQARAAEVDRMAGMLQTLLSGPVPLGGG